MYLRDIFDQLSSEPGWWTYESTPDFDFDKPIAVFRESNRKEAKKFLGPRSKQAKRRDELSIFFYEDSFGPALAVFDDDQQ